MTERVPRRAVVTASGGLDSSTVAYLLASQGTSVHLLSFDYGQRHRNHRSAPWLDRASRRPCRWYRASISSLMTSPLRSGMREG